MIKNYCDIPPMIWLASFPRSGNTFFRNVLYEVYGISSSTYHQDSTRPLEEGFASFPVVKTHLLPDQLPPNLRNCKSVYIVRDGRDALVSIAHHRKDIVTPGSDYFNNLLLAILALNDSYFGGWSANVEAWTSKADIIIKFEDLIKNPIGEISKLSAIIDLPAPDLSRLPSFETLKFGNPQYGAGGEDVKKEKLAEKHFRKGKVAGYKTEMPVDLQQLFWDLHGATMLSQGYQDDQLKASSVKPEKKILLEVSKAFSNDNDGVKRYLTELIEHLIQFSTIRRDIHIDLFFNNTIWPINSSITSTYLKKYAITESHEQEHPLAQVVKVADQQKEALQGTHLYENRLLALKAYIKAKLPTNIYDFFSRLYRKGPFRRFLNYLHRKTTARKSVKAFRKLQKNIDSYDLVHLPLPQNMHLIQHANTKFLVTAHDFTHHLFPAYHTENNIVHSEEGIQCALAKNADFIAISKATARDLSLLYRVPREKIKVIYEGANGAFSRESIGKENEARILEKYKVNDGTPYFMTLSTIEPRKNLKGVIAAFLQLKEEQGFNQKLSLLIGGKKGWKYHDLEKSEEDLKKQNVYFTGFIPDSELPVLYNNAIALCYLSHYEGFGLPLLEAMQSGTTVIFGSNSSMPEVVGEGGLGVNTKDVSAIAKAMKQLLLDPEMRLSLVEKARIQSYKFSWLKAAFETINYYEKLISNNKP
ncbi:glycosyltransferase [Lewinella sp. LCG006]|uniref:glycosyltransferase n=1 Tax=Lewinella sp. LCG006 TaxID=3231911 RepID=UPI00346088FA